MRGILALTLALNILHANPNASKAMAAKEARKTIAVAGNNSGSSTFNKQTIIPNPLLWMGRQ